MALPLYLAMTAAEFHVSIPLKSPMAWMACHFSSYGTGLSNLPPQLPAGSAIILNDQTELSGHDPIRISQQLSDLLLTQDISCILLDFERSFCPEAAGLAAHLCASLPCPVGVSQPYTDNMNCPVFLPPIPPDVLPQDYLAPHQGKEIWLEVDLPALQLTVTEEGCICEACGEIPSSGFADAALHSHYRIQTGNAITCTIWRTADDLHDLMEEVQNLGVTRFFGLHQELECSVQDLL